MTKQQFAENWSKCKTFTKWTFWLYIKQNIFLETQMEPKLATLTELLKPLASFAPTSKIWISSGEVEVIAVARTVKSNFYQVSSF